MPCGLHDNMQNKHSDPDTAQQTFHISCSTKGKFVKKKSMSSSEVWSRLIDVMDISHFSFHRRDSSSHWTPSSSSAVLSVILQSIFKFRSHEKWQREEEAKKGRRWTGFMYSIKRVRKEEWNIERFFFCSFFTRDHRSCSVVHAVVESRRSRFSCTWNARGKFP